MSDREIPISNLRIGKAFTTDVLHFTGGLKAMPVVGGGWVIGPVEKTENGLGYLGPLSYQDMHSIIPQAHCYYVGLNKVHMGPDPECSEFWYPHIGDTSAKEQTSDSWAAVAFQAREVKDQDTSDIARNLSIALRSAGWRLKDVSRLHNQQLEWAILRGRKSGDRFSNIAILDLYLAIHSLLAEMCSARDYLAQLAAKRVSAKPGTDSLARLQDWLKKEVNAPARADALVKLLTEAAGTKDMPGWLTQLTEMRNQVTHRQPLAAHPNTAALLLQMMTTKSGMLPTIRLSRFRRGEKFEEEEDPSVALLRFWLFLEALSRASLTLMPYVAKHPNFAPK